MTIGSKLSRPHLAGSKYQIWGNTQIWDLPPNLSLWERVIWRANFGPFLGQICEAKAIWSKMVILKLILGSAKNELQNDHLPKIAFDSQILVILWPF